MPGKKLIKILLHGIYGPLNHVQIFLGSFQYKVISHILSKCFNESVCEMLQLGIFWVTKIIEGLNNEVWENPFCLDVQVAELNTSTTKRKPGDAEY